MGRLGRLCRFKACSALGVDVLPRSVMMNTLLASYD